MAMNKVRRTSNINNVVTYDTSKNVVLPANLTLQGLVSAGFVKADAQGLFSVDTAAYTPTTRTITINGVSYDLSQNRSWDAIPTGGTTGQILAKVDGTNYNATWIDNYTSEVKHIVKAGETINKGQAVYVSSADGTNMIVSKASNASESTSSKTMGLLAQNLATNGQGYVITEGLLSGLNTSTASAGDPVWLGTNGDLIFGLTNKPYAPNHLVFIGIVTRVNLNNGEIFVKVQNGFELQELHNIQITSTPSDNTVLSYETATSLYKMKSISTLLGYTPVTNARTLTINGTSYDLTQDRSWSVEPVITSGTSSQYWRGDKTWQTLNTAAVTESSNLYFTEPRVLSTVLTGLNLVGGGTIASTDSVLTAFGKVQNQLSAMVGGVIYQGVWNATTNSPTITSSVGTKGQYYVVSVAGSTTINGINDWKIGDWIIFNGSTWDKVDNTDAVSSVNNFTGAVSLGLGNLNDVTLTSPTGGQLLRFNGTSSKWENWTPSYVVYSGATANVDLGNYTLFASNIIVGVAAQQGYIQLRTGGSVSLPTETSMAASSTTGVLFNFDASGTYRRFILSAASLTTNTPRTYTMPDASGTIALTSNLSSYQPLDADLTAIAALSGTSGLLKKTAADTWALDTNTYLTAEADTLATVTGRGATTTTNTTFSNKLYVGGTMTQSTGYNGLFGTPQVGAYSGGKLIYFYNDGTTIKLDAYDYTSAGAIGFNIGGNGGTVNIASGATVNTNLILHAGNYSSYAIPISGGINMSGSFGLNDQKLYLRTNGDTNHYIWNAADDWEEIVAYSGTGLRISSSTGTTLATFSTSGNSMNITGSAGSVAWSGVTSKPSLIMYYQGFTLDANTMDGNSSGFTYSVNAPYTGPIIRISETGYSLQLNAPYSGGGTALAFRTRNGDAGTWNSWRYVITTDTIGSQSVNYASSAGSSSQVTINYSNDSNSTYQMLWGSGNSVYGTGGIYCNPSSDIVYASAFVGSSYVNGAYFSGAVSGSSYGSIKVAGTTGSYAGIYLSDASGTVAGMHDTSGNGGTWDSTTSWHFYWNRGNTCLGIGTSTTSSSYKAYVGGGLYATGNVVAYSDVRKKTNINTIENALDIVSKMRGVYYNRIDDESGKRETGVIAQEINVILPEVVTYAADNDEYGVAYGNFAGVFIESIKELRKENKELKKEIELLKNR